MNNTILVSFTTSLLTTIITSIVIHILKDRLYPIINQQKHLYETMKTCPRLYFGKYANEKLNNAKLYIFSTNIYANNKQESVIGIFEQVTNVLKINNIESKYFVLINNNYNQPILINGIVDRANQPVNIDGFDNKRVNQNEELAILFDIGNKPTKITASFEGYSVSYNTESIENDFIMPLLKLKRTRRNKK